MNWELVIEMILEAHKAGCVVCTRDDWCEVKERLERDLRDKVEAAEWAIRKQAKRN